jgi:hypothetical protein
MYFLSPDKKAAWVRRVGGGKTLPGCGNSVLYYFFPDEKSGMGSKSGGWKTLARMRKQYLIIFLLPDKKAARVLREGSGKPMSCTTVFFFTRE